MVARTPQPEAAGYGEDDDSGDDNAAKGPLGGGRTHLLILAQSTIVEKQLRTQDTV